MAFHNPQMEKEELRVLPATLKEQGAQFLAKLPAPTNLWAIIEDAWNTLVTCLSDW